MNTRKEKLVLKAETHSPGETQEIALRFAGMIQPGEVAAFYGDLGSGKTFFIQTLCRALGCEQQATSPSFTIINEYRANEVMIYHFDFYRLENKAELFNIGLDEFFYDHHICLIEWADKIKAYLPKQRWDIYLKFIENQPESRHILIEKILDESHEG